MALYEYYMVIIWLLHVKDKISSILSAYRKNLRREGGTEMKEGQGADTK